MKTIILMPAYNEAAVIHSVVEKVAGYGTPLVIDDGSTDDTAALAAQAGAHVLKLPENRGYEMALNAGFAEAEQLGADIVVTFDADGQFDSHLLADMVRPIERNEADLVIGTRPRPARISEALFGLYTRARHGVRDILCGVKAYRMALYHERRRFDSGASVGTEFALAALRRRARVALVPVHVKPRVAGASRFGQGLSANMRIFKALGLAIRDDLAALIKR